MVEKKIEIKLNIAKRGKWVSKYRRLELFEIIETGHVAADFILGKLIIESFLRTDGWESSITIVKSDLRLNPKMLKEIAEWIINHYPKRKYVRITKGFKILEEKDVFRSILEEEE